MTLQQLYHQHLNAGGILIFRFGDVDDARAFWALDVNRVADADRHRVADLADLGSVAKREPVPERHDEEASPA